MKDLLNDICDNIQKKYFLPVSDDEIKFYILHQILFFLHFEAIVSYLKLSAHKEQPNDL